ncbi:jg3546 [Pararge aegeria aegeria]|uniref:Jg3546 protein n=1 Tax=Pararge aegeria aegeria TaxID=348720 RepID=A0A8S4RMI0_9NEOP|nr:jg3546 [Pararge aegeria aegeria]
MSQFCFICNKLLTEDETVVVSRGMPTLIDASVARSDEFADYLRSQKSVTIHVDCRKSYTRKTSISASKRQREEEQASTSKVSPPHTRARISESSFCFKNNCLFCGDEADEEAEKKKVKIYRRKIHKVSTLTFKDSILKLAKDRSDDVSKAVFARINFQYDLVAADAKYHDSCYKSFLRPNTGGKIGRPQSEAINSAMEEIFNFIESSDDCQFSLDELKNVCQNVALENGIIKIRLELNTVSPSSEDLVTLDTVLSHNKSSAAAAAPADTSLVTL